MEKSSTERFKFTKPILEKAQKLRDTKDSVGSKMLLGTVAERLGCGVVSLSTTLHNYRTGKWKGRIDVRDERRDIIEKRVVDAGGRVSVSKLAREFGVSRPAMSQLLKRMGYDKEVREEMSEVQPKTRVAEKT